MFWMPSATVAGHFVATGVITTAAVAGRGLVHSVRLAAQSQYGAAGLQALAALATLALLAQTATAELLVDVIDTARELSGQTLDATQPTLNTEKAAWNLSNGACRAAEQSAARHTLLLFLLTIGSRFCPR